MSDTKTLGEKLEEAKKQVHDASEAKWLADNAVGTLERRLKFQAEDFGKLQQDPDYQQAMLAQWKHWCDARKASGLGIEEFIQARWEAEGATAPKESSAPAPGADEYRRHITEAIAKQYAPDDHNTHLRLLREREAMERAKMEANAVKAKAMSEAMGGGPPPAPCSCGAMQACARCPELQVTPEIAAYIDDHAKAKTAHGVNSVVRGDGERQQSWHSGRIEMALDDLHRALLEKRADPYPLHMVVEVDRSAMNALAAEYRMRWPHLPKEGVHGTGGGAFQVNVPSGTILVREKK